MAAHNDTTRPSVVDSSTSNSLASEIWAALTSELDVLSAEILGTTQSLPYPSSVPARMTTTIDITVPYSTVTIDSTVLKTSLVTVTAALPSSTAPGIQSSSPLQTSTLVTDTSLIPSSSRRTFTTSHVSLPVIATTSPPHLASSSHPSSAAQPSDQAGSTTTPAAGTQATSTSSSSQSSQKHAIIGGLCGAIAGCILIGLLICLILRIRRKQIDSDPASLNEKGARQSVNRRLTSLVRAHAKPQHPAQPAEHSSPTAFEEDQNVIRMNTQHWPRPFVTGEGWRDSVPPGQLRVTNPDTSRPGTPRRSSEIIAGAFSRRPRPAVPRAFSGARRSRPTSPQRYGSSRDVPEIRIDPVAPQEIPAVWRPATSSKSCPSVSTMSVIRQHPLEDPFLNTPHNSGYGDTRVAPHYEYMQSALSLSTSPSEAPPTPPPHGPFGILRQWGSLLNPFRPRANPGLDASNTDNTNTNTNTRAFPQFSPSTFSSRPSRHSDPFDLDRPSPRRSHLFPPRPADGAVPAGRASNWTVYEGT